jgi:hypothetical protein
MDSLSALIALWMDSPGAWTAQVLSVQTPLEGGRVLAGQARPTHIMPTWFHLCKHLLIIFKRFVIHAAKRLLG